MTRSVHFSIRKLPMAGAFACIGLPLSPGAHASDVVSGEAFAQAFVAALNSHDAGRQAQIAHPLSRACMTPQAQPYFDWIFSRRSRYSIPGGYKSSVMPFPGNATLSPDGRSDYPIRPTHQLQIDFERGPYDSASIVVMLASDNGRWYEVLPCPRPETVVSAKASNAHRAEQENRARDVAAKLSAQSRKEALVLAREGRRVDAIKHIAATTGEDLAVAKRVLELLMESEPALK